MFPNVDSCPGLRSVSYVLSQVWPSAVLNSVTLSAKGERIGTIWAQVALPSFPPSSLFTMLLYYYFVVELSVEGCLGAGGLTRPTLAE